MRLLALTALLVSTAHAAPRAFVVASVGDAPAREGPIESRQGEPVHLYAVLQDGPRYYTAAPALRIAGRRVPATRIAPLDFPVTWSLVEPRQHHVATPYPNFGNPAYSNSFDLLFRGTELITGGQRLHVYADYLAALEKANLPTEPFETYLEAFRYGMPPHGGFAIGLERLLMQLLGLPNLRLATLFPRDQKRLTP